MCWANKLVIAVSCAMIEYSACLDLLSVVQEYCIELPLGFIIIWTNHLIGTFAKSEDFEWKEEWVLYVIAWRGWSRADWDGTFILLTQDHRTN